MDFKIQKQEIKLKKQAHKSAPLINCRISVGKILCVLASDTMMKMPNVFLYIAGHKNKAESSLIGMCPMNLFLLKSVKQHALKDIFQFPNLFYPELHHRATGKDEECIEHILLLLLVFGFPLQTKNKTIQYFLPHIHHRQQA